MNEKPPRREEVENDYMEDQDQDPDEEGSVIILYVEGLFYIFEVLGDKTNLFVKNLPRNMSEQKLHQIFSVFGEVSSAKIMMGRRSGESLGFGFVRFAKEDDAARAILDMNGKIVQSKQLTVKYASPPKNRGPMTPSLTLYVKPLLPSFTEAELRALFTPYGEITEVKILYDHETNLKRQVGFIRFAQMESSIKAQKAMDGYRHSLFTSSLTVRFAETPEQKRKRREEKERTIIANQRKGKEGEKIHETTTPTIQTQNVTLNNSKGNAGMGGNAPWYDGAGLVPGLAGVSVPNIMTNNLDRIFRGVGNNNLLGSSLQNQLLNSVGGGSNITELMNAALSNIGNLLNHPFGFEIIMNWIKMNNLAGNMNNNNNFNHNNNALNQMDLYNFLGFLNSNVNPVNSATPSMFNLGEKKVMLTPKNIALLNLIASNQNNSPSPYLPPPIVQGEMMEKDQTTSFANSKITSGVLLNNSMGINPDSINEKASLASGFSSNASSIPPMNFLTPPATSSVPVAHGCPNAPFPKGTLSQKSLQFNTSQNTFPKMHSPPSTVANSESTSSDVFNRDDFRQSQSVLSKALTTSSVFIPRRYLGEEQMPLMNGRINNSAGITGLNQAGSYNNHNLQNHINPLINQTPQNVTPFPPGLLNYSGVNALGGTGGWANNNSGINTVASSSPHVTELGVKMGFEGPLNLSPNSCVGNVNNNLNSFLQNSLNTPQNIHPQPIICSPKVATPSFVSNTTMMQYPNPNTPIMNVDSNTTPSCFLEGGGIFNHSNNVMESGQRMSNSPGTTSFSPESPSYIGSVPFINTQQQFIPKSQHIVNPKPLTLSPMFITNSTSVTPTNPIAVSLFPSSPPQALIGDPDQSSCSLSFPSPSAPSFSLPMSSSNYLVNGNETCSHFQINNNPSLISSEAPHSGLPLIIGGDSENFDRKNVDQYSQLWTNTLEFGRGVKPSVAVNSCGGKGNEFGVGGRFGSGIKEKVNEFKDNKNDKKGVSYLDQYPPICLTSSSASGSSFSTSTSNFSGSDSSSSSQVSFSPSSSSLFGAVKNPPSQFLLKNFPRDLPLSKPTVEMLFNDLKQNRQAQIRNKNRVEKSCSPDAFTLGDFVNFVGENVGSQGLNNGGNNTHNNNTNSSIENKPDANFSFNLDHPVDEFMFNSSNTILDNGLMNNNTKINVLNQDNCFPFNMHISPFPPPLIFSDTVVKSPKMIPDMGSIPMIFNSPSHRRANYQMSSSLDNVELPTVLTTPSELICTGLPSPVTGNALLSTSPFRVSSMSVGDDQLEKEVMQPIRPATMQDNLLGYNKGTEILKKRIAGSGENASLIDGNDEQRLNEEIMKGKTSSSVVVVESVKQQSPVISSPLASHVKSSKLSSSLSSTFVPHFEVNAKKKGGFRKSPSSASLPISTGESNEKLEVKSLEEKNGKLIETSGRVKNPDYLENDVKMNCAILSRCSTTNLKKKNKLSLSVSPVMSVAVSLSSPVTPHSPGYSPTPSMDEKSFPNTNGKDGEEFQNNIQLDVSSKEFLVEPSNLVNMDISLTSTSFTPVSLESVTEDFTPSPSVSLEDGYNHHYNYNNGCCKPSHMVGGEKKLGSESSKNNIDNYNSGNVKLFKSFVNVSNDHFNKENKNIDSNKPEMKSCLSHDSSLLYASPSYIDLAEDRNENFSSLSIYSCSSSTLMSPLTASKTSGSSRRSNDVDNISPDSSPLVCGGRKNPGNCGRGNNNGNILTSFLPSGGLSTVSPTSTPIINGSSSSHGKHNVIEDEL